MPLLTIADLEQPASIRNKYVQHAMQLGTLWDQWKAQYSGDTQVLVEFHGEGGRAAGIHASEISKCLRRLVYAARGLPRKVLPEQRDINMQRRMDIGTLTHAIVQHEFHEMCEWLGSKITFEDEVRINPKIGGPAEQWSIHSSCDGIFTFWYEGQPYLRVGLEIKTMSDPEFTKMKEPLDYHQDQVCTYMACLNLPLMWILCINKSNSRYSPAQAPFLFQFDSTRWATKLEPRLATTWKMAVDSSGVLPGREEGNHCSWCPFAYECRPQRLQRGKSSPTVTARDF